MPPKHKKDEVTVSFHYLQRFKQGEDDEPVAVAFTRAEFNELHDHLVVQKQNDIADPEIADQIRYRHIAQIREIEKTLPSYISGIYRASYWGHAYENTAVGSIPADSINLRPFFFLLYLSQSGKIYLASQYLGTFGGYTAIKNSVLNGLRDKHEVEAVSFNVWGNDYSTMQVHEVEIRFSKNGESIASSNVFGRRGAITLTKRRGEDSFEEEVTKKLLKPIRENRGTVKNVLNSFLQEQRLVEVNDDDITDCKMVAYVNGRKKIIHLIEEGSFASRIPVQVPLNNDGHPFYAPLKDAAIEVLKTRVIAMAENV